VKVRYIYTQKGKVPEMKRHPGWLAAGLLLFAVLACNMSKNHNYNSNNSNSNSNSNSNKRTTAPTVNRPADAEVYVDRIRMAKDDNGDPGASATTFNASDHTIHCVADLNKAKGGTTMKFVWTAVDVANGQNGEIRAIDYTTRSFENKIHAHLTAPKDWPKGSYRVEVYVNGALDKVIDFTVE
jgi:hypothetical protein